MYKMLRITDMVKDANNSGFVASASRSLQALCRSSVCGEKRVPVAPPGARRRNWAKLPVFSVE